MGAGLSRCAVPTSIHCDHLIQAVDGASSDLQVIVICLQHCATVIDASS